MRLTTYLYLSLLHLIPIEMIFFFGCHYFPDWSQSILFLNYIYGIIVIIHAVHYWKDRILDIVVRILIQKMRKEFKLDKKPVGEEILGGFDING